MERQYIRIKPSREKLNPEDLISHISSLHKLTSREHSNSVAARLNPLKDSSETVPKFELLAISEGKDSPVEFFYGTDSEQISALENRLTTAYPPSFDIDIVDVDVLQKIIPPEKYAPDDFVKKMDDGALLFDPDATGTVTDIEQGDADTTTSGSDTTNPQSQSSVVGEGTAGKNAASTNTTDSPAGSDDTLSLNVARASETTKPREEEVTTSSGETKKLTPADIDGYDMLEELDAGLLDIVELPDEIEDDFFEQDIDGPTWTDDGDILARPTLERCEPVAARWNGRGERKKDWMTTMKMFSKIARPDADDIQDRAPLATLIQHLAASNLPIAFQVVFERIEDWSRQGERRKSNLQLDRDTLGQKIRYEVGEILHSPSKERQRERMRDYMEDMGESADQSAESPITGDVGKRRKLIDNKIPKRTFRVNIRAVSVANDEVPVKDVEETMEDLSSVLDHIDGYFYGVEPEILRDGQGRLREKDKATEEFHRFVNRDITTGSGKVRPDLVLNGDELGNFIVVPSSRDLTVEGTRGTRAEAEARDPLAKPDSDLMRQFHQPGMRVGYALDKTNNREPVPTQVPPGILTKHFGRFATTGAGKSKALINDILSLKENSNGPIILIDPKGDGMTENYMKAHFERFGEDDFKDNVIHYPIPDILPGFTFFNINPAMEQGKRRADAIQNKADHYQELLKLVMGRENYEDSKVAPTMISALIKALFDEYYVDKQMSEGQNQETDSILTERESPNQFTHRHLEKLTKQVRMYGAEGDSNDGHIPDVSNEAVKDTLEEQAEGDSRTFATIMNAVFNRLNYIREDEHLRKIFNNTEENFDLRDHLYDNKVILFDLGDLREDATMVMTGLILTNLWDALQEADRTSCTQGHESIEECRERAKRNGLDPTDPQCREPWDDDHLVNLVIDEAASVAVSSIMNKMLEQGRSFNLSVGLSMQYPEQMKSAGSDRTYKNVLNNMATKLIGKITLDEEIAKAMAHEGMDVTDFSNRIKALPRGEWIAQLPSPTFMETGPEPFSLEPLPIPAGHPESQNVLTEEADQRFEYFLSNHVHRRTEEEYGIGEDAKEDMAKSPNQRATGVDTSNLRDGKQASAQSEHDANTTPASANGSTPDAENGAAHTNGDGGDVETFSDYIRIEDTEQDEENLPAHIEWEHEAGVYVCQVCGSEYFPGEKEDAVMCCADAIDTLVETVGDVTSIESLEDMDGYTTSSESYPGLDGEVRHYSATIDTDATTFTDGHTPTLNDIEITRPKDMFRALGAHDAVTIGSVASAVVAAIPPEYQRSTDKVIDHYWKNLDEADSVTTDVSLSERRIQELIHTTPPADLEIDVEQFLTAVRGSVSQAILTRWENNDCPPAFKRFYSGDISINKIRAPSDPPRRSPSFSHTGTYGNAYSPYTGLSKPVTPDHHTPESFPLPDPDDHTSMDDADSPTDVVPVKKVEAPGVTDDQLAEYGITRSEARFMRAVVKAMNHDLEGYTLTDSMTDIRNQYEINEAKLIDVGYIKKHTGTRNRTYYTVTADGQDACGIMKDHGRGVGDIGADTPHRVGVDLAKQYYEGLPHVKRVEISTKQDGDETDLVVVDTNGDRIAIVEVEAGQTSADEYTDENSRVGIRDYESIRKDYHLLADSPGESVWIVRNNEIAATVLTALDSGDNDKVPFELPDGVIDDVESTDIKISGLNDNYISKVDDPGVDKVLTYMQLRNRLSDRDSGE